MESLSIRSFVNIYYDDAMVYGCTLKTLDDQRLVADISSDLVLESQWWENCLVTINASTSKRVIFPPPRRPDEDLTPIMMNENSLREDPGIGRQLGHKTRPRGTLTSDP